MAATEPLVLLEVDDAVATLTLNRPDAGNALDLPLMVEFRERAQDLAERTDVRVVVLRAAGRMFCVGGDLGWMAEHADRQAALRSLADELHAGLLILRGLDAPIVAVVHSTAAGAGLSLAAGSDIAIAVDTAKFTMAYTKVGLSPDGGSTWLLPRLIGTRRATELMLMNPTLTAAQAVEVGLITRAVPADELEGAVATVVDTLRDASLASSSAVKRLLDASATSTFEDQMQLEAESIAGLAAGPEGREGVGAFLERRPADFRGAAG
ncbi:Trans-2-decenoyl-[acyl-carrier-protein] isomerase [Paraconexibacter sp. AEG42_29]|uniref:Trans-2-decenoyl-[acyl-carrier-protein] isomerase n=1 Tax=Paraconexibacter sp. AEG42_29 TaxID=2997339 RepID=A0AAU7ATA3_9ACTN